MRFKHYCYFSFVLRVPLLFWSDNVFFPKKINTLYHAIVDDFTRSYSFMRKHFCYTFDFFFQFLYSILPVKTKMFNKPMWREKKFICDVFFFWPLPFLHQLHSLREREKNCEKQQNGALLWPPSFFLIWCTWYRAYNAHVSIQCVWRKQCAEPQKKWGKWYFAANVQHLNCAGKRRVDCIHFIRSIFRLYRFHTYTYTFRMILSIHMSLCLLSQNIQLWTPDITTTLCL